MKKIAPIKRPPKLPLQKTKGGRYHRRPASEWKKPFIPTDAEMARRIEFFMQLIANQPNLSRYKLHQIGCKKFHVVWKTIDSYVARARDLLRERLKRDSQEVRADAVSFYEAVISNPNETTINRLKAQGALVELLGVSAPQKLEVTGAEGSPLLPAETRVFLGTLTVERMKLLIGELETEEPTAPDNKAA